MRLLRKKDYPGGRFTLAFVGYGDEADHTVIELTHNWDTERYDIGSGFGHLALGVRDIYGDLRGAARQGRQDHPRARPDEARHAPRSPSSRIPTATRSS